MNVVACLADGLLSLRERQTGWGDSWDETFDCLEVMALANNLVIAADAFVDLASSFSVGILSFAGSTSSQHQRSVADDGACGGLSEVCWTRKHTGADDERACAEANETSVSVLRDPLYWPHALRSSAILSLMAFGDDTLTSVATNVLQAWK